MRKKPPIGPEEVGEAAQILQRYKAGKAALDKRLVDNELWFRMGHWKNYQNKMMEGKPQPSSGWLFNSIANKLSLIHISSLCGSISTVGTL